MFYNSGHARAELFELLKKYSFKRGKFILASGKEAEYYMDCRMTTLSARGAFLIGKLFYEKLEALHLDAVGGMALGAVPIVSAVSLQSAEAGRSLDGFLIRKEAKGHGTARQIEGHLSPWMRVALVEDVVTTGGSTKKAVEAIQRAYPSVQIVKILSIVDREEGGRQAFQQLGIPFESLYSVQEFLRG